MARHTDGAIAERARTALGLVTAGDLDALGVSRQHRRTLVARGVLERVTVSTYRHAAVPRTWPQAVLAAVVAAGEGAVASHMAAAGLWRFDGVDPGAVEVTVPHERRPQRVPGRLHRSRSLTAADVDRGPPIPCTTPSRTLVDIAAQVEPAQLERILDGAVRRGQIWVPHLRWRVDALRRRGRQGPAEVAALLDRTEGRDRGESWLEDEALRVIATAGLPLPRCQVTMRPGGGIARVDLTWDERCLVAEFDGHGTHATRRQRQADAERAARLTLAGYRVLRFTYEDVTERPDYVVTTIDAHLAALGAA